MKTSDLKISPAVIWTSSIILGVLSSVPQLASHSFNWKEAVVNAALTSGFAIIMWYVNLYFFDSYHKKISQRKISNKQISYSRLFITFGVGIVIMFVLAWLQQLILSHINFGPVMLMIEVRGLLINLICFTFLYLLQQNFENRHITLELEQMRNDNLAAQYELLKQQINPHFLFNSLNTLKSMVDNQEPEAAGYIIKLSNFYRYTLESRKSDLITLKEEMNIVDAFIYLQKARFANGFEFINQLEADAENTLLPPFSLQLLLENCLKHNIVSEENPLQIRLYSENGWLILENQVQLKSGDHHSLGVGLENIRLRYQHLTEQQVVVQQSETLFTIKLPMIYENPHH